MTDLSFYTVAILAIIIGFVFFKKITGCIIRIILTVILLVILAVFYLFTA